MPVLARVIQGVAPSGVACLGSVQADDTTLVWPCVGQSIDALRSGFGDRLIRIDGARHAVRAVLMGVAGVDGTEAEHDLFKGRRVLVAVRTGEPAEAVQDWLDYHAAEHGADAALILDRSPPENAGFLSDFDTSCTVVVVTCDQPLAAPNAPDLTTPETAPAAPKRGQAPVNPWFGPLREHGIHDLLRHRFLAGAQAVAFVNIGDLILPLKTGETVFDRAAAASGAAVPLRGLETYPWRLRQGAAAPYGDHIASRRHERRVLQSWAVAPEAVPDAAFWRPFPPLGMAMDEGPPVMFVRAMGVVYPGVPVNRLVRKSDLREQPALVDLMQRRFKHDPIRLPAPSAIPPRPKHPKVTVVTAMKNEGPFVLDWIAHQKAIGVTDVLVYTNDCADGTDRLLDALTDASVHHRVNPYRQSGKVPQYAAFRAAESEPVVSEADWLMTLDVDEYLNIHEGDGTLGALMDATAEAHVISVPWRLFGNADVARFADVPVVEQFTACAPAFAPRPLQAWAFKTLYRNEGLFRRLGVHRPKGLVKDYRDSLVWVDASGRVLPPATWDKAWRMNKAHWGYANATLNHYAVRSAESFLVKRDRGKVNRTRREQGLAYWFRMNHNATEDHSILRLAERVAEQKARLLALPGVAEAHAEAVAWHVSRIAALRADEDYAAFFDKITSERMQHLSRIATNFGANVHMVGPDVIPDEIAASDPAVPFYWTVKLSGG